MATKKLKSGPVYINGVKYIPADMTAEILGCSVYSLYRSKTKAQLQAYKYLGVLLFEAKAVEQYKATVLLKKAS